jgi:hypothetical protein
MDERELEQSLREAWQIDPPENALSRILARAEVETARPRSLALGRLRFAFTCALLLALLLAHGSALVSQNRIAALTGDGIPSISTPLRDHSPLLKMRRDMERMLALGPGEERSQGNTSRSNWQ